MMKVFYVLLLLLIANVSSDSLLEEMCKRFKSPKRDQIRLQDLSIDDSNRNLYLVESDYVYRIPLTWLDINHANMRMALFDRGVSNDEPSRLKVRHWHEVSWAKRVMGHAGFNLLPSVTLYKLRRARSNAVELLFDPTDSDPDTLNPKRVFAPKDKTKLASFPRLEPTDYGDWEDWIESHDGNGYGVQVV